MKTIEDLKEMKNKTIIPFGNQYDYFFATLENYYMSKLDGLDRVKAELSNWDREAQQIIVNRLANIVSENGIIGFDKNEILLLGENIDKISCYIEEYRNQQGNICARLRDKVSNKRISIIGNNTDKNHLLRFLSQAKLNQQMMPTIFDRNGTDIVAVRGIVSSEDNEEIIINIDVESGGYLFE
ncbi:MAG: hypothetical protein K1W19_04435 [Lachnospiraceae bacterium]